MDLSDESRLTWERAQRELQQALSHLEECVQAVSDPSHVDMARMQVAAKKKLVDECLQRHITQLGKS